MTENIALIGLSISIFTLVTMISKSKLSLSDGLLCSWLVVIGIPMLLSMDVQTLWGINLLSFYNPTFNLLHGPLLYFYVRTLTQVRSSLERKDLLHLTPFALLYVLSIFTGLSHQMVPGTLAGIESFIFSSNIFVSEIETVLLHFGMLNVVSFLIYSAVVVRLLILHQQIIVRYFSRKDTQITLSWIYALPTIFLGITLLNIFNESDVNPFVMVQPMLMHMFSHCSMAILLCFFGVRQKPVFKADSDVDVTSHIAKVTPTEAAPIFVSEASKPSSSQAPDLGLDLELELESKPVRDKQLLEQAHVEVLKSEIDVYMLSEKPFLNPDFSVYLLAEEIKIPRHTLSFVLSSGFDNNFYQFVNGYRLEEMKAWLRDNANNDTILDIAFACGFSSKSTYNTLFKKQCGCTPTQFRKRAQDS
jgi:AraC-like DNA-binding protein